MRRLSNATLSALPSAVARPAYDRADVSPGIVHLGVGAFHRCHQAVYVDDRLAAGETGWGIVAASLRKGDVRDALGPQDGLYGLAVRADSGTRHRVIGSISDVLVAPEAPGRLLDALCDPRVRIVTLTVTEKGYCIDIAGGALRTGDADLDHDLAGGAPRTPLGFLAAAIARRRAQRAPPFTVLSCDNLPHNGATVRKAVLAFARRRDPALARFVEDEIAFPSCMVDRIVPATTDSDRAEIAAALGLEDAWPTVCEPFSQWVVEDRFPSGRPRLEEAGVEFVADVAPHEHMKLRLLNGAHTSIAAAGRLAGFATVAEAFADPAIRGFVDAYWREVAPTLAVGEPAARDYAARLAARFANRALPHRTAQIAMDASQKVPQRLLGGLRDLRKAGRPFGATAMAVALWIRSCGGFDDEGQAFAIDDPVFARWTGAPDQRSAGADEVVAAYLGFAAVFGDDLPRDGDFVDALARAYADVAGRGTLAAVRAVR
ncbi:MAG: mannitol dehydrogenase family protein [Hyphomicrobiales bacterium]|nr:mannitol dehydrogenase family protein [Hyphomicrobiales bacterium]MDE2017347.1 mannitol dehydrogenase family protein [Hyphomicrobiales bacterium]